MFLKKKISIFVLLLLIKVFLLLLTVFQKIKKVIEQHKAKNN
jgi:hypothetical protein